MLKRVGHWGLAIILVVAPVVVGLSRSALADPATCPVTVVPQTIYANSATNFTVTVTNSTANAIQWILLNPPSANYSFTSGSADGWNASILDAQALELTGGNLAPGDSLNVTIPTQ